MAGSSCISSIAASQASLVRQIEAPVETSTADTVGVLNGGSKPLSCNAQPVQTRCSPALSSHVASIHNSWISQEPLGAEYGPGVSKHLQNVWV